MINVLFSVEAVDGANKLLVRYKDGTFDVMTRKQVHEELGFAIPKGNGEYETAEEAISAAVIDESVPEPDFFEQIEEERSRKSNQKIRSFSADSGLI